MFCVDFKHDCAHQRAVTDDAEAVIAWAAGDSPAQCGDCAHSVETWLCAHCLRVGCGRHVQAHALAHAHAAQHWLCVSLADISVWCHACDAYVTPSGRLVSLVHALASDRRFGRVRPDQVRCLCSLASPRIRLILAVCGQRFNILLKNWL